MVCEDEWRVVLMWFMKVGHSWNLQQEVPGPFQLEKTYSHELYLKNPPISLQAKLVKTDC